MERYSIPLVPGPVSIPPAVLAAYGVDYGSADLEEEFFGLYATCEADLQRLLATKNDVTIQSGEGMLALWGALKSVLEPGDRVLAVSTGLFGAGIGEMARTCGAEVETLDFGNDDVADPAVVRAAALAFSAQTDHRRALRNALGHPQPSGRVGRDFCGSGGIVLRRFCRFRRRHAGAGRRMEDRSGPARQPEGLEPHARSLHDFGERSRRGRL